MDFDLKLKALSRLAQSTTEAASIALRKEFDKATNSLNTDKQYPILEQCLELLHTIGHRFSSDTVKALENFINGIGAREILYADEVLSEESATGKYLNASSLTVRSIEILVSLRYLETMSVLSILIALSRQISPEVRKKAINGLETLAEYDINVFYGDDEHAGIGATPQKQIIDAVEAFGDMDLEERFDAIIALLDGLLSPTMKKASWSYSAVTLSQGATPAHPTVDDIRLHSIKLLKRLYSLVHTASRKLQVINTLNDATRMHGISQSTDDIARMIARDSIDVLEFFAQLVQTEELPIIQKIEHLSYWIFYHSIRAEMASAALVVQSRISNHAEYQIYKILIGFEGIFGDWNELKASGNDWEDIDKFRKAKATEFASSVTPANSNEWRDRILSYSQTQSDDLATFPVFYYFLEMIATNQAELALQLISNEPEKLERFLIPLLRGLWAGTRKDDAKAIVEQWVANGQFLSQSAQQFLANENMDREFLLTIFRKATELEDLRTVATIISVAVSNYTSANRFLIDELFIPAIKESIKHHNANWIYDFWFRREARAIILDLDVDGIDLILRNLLSLNEINYHAEEALYFIAKRMPEKVIAFLCERLTIESKKQDGKRDVFEAIPHELHKLNEPLSRIPDEVVNSVYKIYDGSFSMFMFKGGRLLKTIFPNFSPEFESTLLKIVRNGNEFDLEFVIAILRNYDGEPFIHEVCKQLIKAVPIDSPLRTEILIALENTGVVMGEFGFAEAYERKKNEIQSWLSDPDEKIQEFTKWYVSNLEQMRVADRKRAEEEIALRKHRYGES